MRCRPCSLRELQELVAVSEAAAPRLREAMVQAALRERDAEVTEERWEDKKEEKGGEEVMAQGVRKRHKRPGADCPWYPFHADGRGSEVFRVLAR